MQTHQVAALGGATSEDEDHRGAGTAVLEIVTRVAELAGLEGIARRELHGWESRSEAGEQRNGRGELHLDRQWDDWGERC